MIFIAIGIMLISINSCTIDNNEIELKGDGLTISTGTVCGWCMGSDSLTITEVDTYFEYKSSCDENIYTKEDQTDKSEWNDLIGKLNIEEFKKISLNTCYVCVDGCDYWILISNSSFSHKIRFGYQDSLQIKNIREFVDKLNTIREKYRSGH